MPGHIFPLRAPDGRRAARAPARPRRPSISPGWPASPRRASSARSCTTTARWRGCPTWRSSPPSTASQIVSVADLIAYRRRSSASSAAQTEADLPTDYGVFRVVAYANPRAGEPDLALVMGDVADPAPLLVRLHSECLTGDVFGSRRCDCGDQLDAALE